MYSVSMENSVEIICTDICPLILTIKRTVGKKKSGCNYVFKLV